MIVRKLDSNGDYTFGLGKGNFYQDQPEAVAQAVKTSLALIQGEWFLDTTVGVPYSTQILGDDTIGEYDFAIQDAIIKVPGVLNIADYASYYDSNLRSVTISCIINTLYGQASLTQIL